MKPMPVSAIDLATASGFSMMLAPSASSTSALPDFDDTDRPPCLATRAPAAAATNIDAVDMLNVCEASPPVPTMSTRCSWSATSTLVANSRITCAAAAISPIVSFLTRRPTVSAAIITGDTSPLMMRRISDSISSWKISRCSIVRWSASVSVIAMMSTKLARAAPRQVDAAGDLRLLADRLARREVAHESAMRRAIRGEVAHGLGERRVDSRLAGGLLDAARLLRQRRLGIGELGIRVLLLVDEALHHGGLIAGRHAILVRAGVRERRQRRESDQAGGTNPALHAVPRKLASRRLPCCVRMASG